ncbi:MAG: isocitrate/isopropylmalate family dehydrogenase [Pirellulales bacterium]
MTTHRIAVYPGDGIGVDVTAEAVKVLQAVADSSDFDLALDHLPWGAQYHAEHGSVVPDDYLDTLRGYDAILLGACGWPETLPDHVTLAPLVRIRQAFDQYICMRPSKLYPGVTGPLRDKGPNEVDLVVLRENSEGEYVDLGNRHHQGQPDEFALQTAVHTRRGIERILRFGFDMASKRRGRLTMVTKSNAQRYAYGLWDDIFEEIRSVFPDIQSDRQHADAAAMNMVRCPERFDVVVASNLFGDLLTDLAGVVGGGLGLAASTNINPERTAPSMFEPVHGSAPDIAGQGIANPVAAVLSAAMMLDWLGEAPAAERIRRAVEQTLAAGQTTPDLGGGLTTVQMGDELVRRLGD